MLEDSEQREWMVEAMYSADQNLFLLWVWISPSTLVSGSLHHNFFFAQSVFLLLPYIKDLIWYQECKGFHFLTQFSTALELPLCCRLKFSCQSKMGYYSVHLNKESKMKIICSWPREVYKIWFFFLWTKYILGITDCLLLLRCTEISSNRRFLSISGHCLVWATREKMFGLY
jgi:hypothetical protein